MIRTEARFRFALLASTALSAVPAMAGDRLPTGGSVAHGSVDISTPSANAMAIRQSSDTAIVNWRGFSIGEGARVDILQPGVSSAMLNRVTGSTPSSIAGQLNANGQVYLVNPNGIAITPTGTVKTGAFVASTLATTDEDFIAGRRSFRGKGRSAAVVNQGSIEVGRGGYAALIGGRVDNSGTITANMGKIGLGAGEHATLDISGDGFLQVGVPSDDDGDDTPLIRHSGRLSADGGRVEVKAATARQMARQVVNLSGVVEARSVGGRSGAIVLGGGDGGSVRVSGRLDASAPRAPRAEAPASIAPPPPRPSITVTGAAIELVGATLDASAPDGGGTIRIGGDWQGGGSLPHAATATVDAATTIAADALASGDGGSVVVWSDEHTAFAGRISARGGPLGGDGGLAEVSGKAKLSYTGIADLSATQGAFGTLLLDPSNILINDGSTTGEFVTDDGGISVAAIIDGPTSTFLPDLANSVLNADQLLGQLVFANVVVSTASTDAAAGNITVAVPLAWTSGALLTLTTVAGDITIDALINAGGNGGLTTSTAGTTTVNAPITVGAAGSLSMTSGPLIVKAPITGGDGATVTLAASGSSIALADLSLGTSSFLNVTSTTVGLDGPLSAGDGSDLTIDADDAPLTVNGAITLGDNVSLVLNGGGVTLGGPLTAGEGALISVNSGGTLTDFIALNGDWTVAEGADGSSTTSLSFTASDEITVAGAITLGNGVNLDFTGGGVTLDGALTAGPAATVSVTSAGSPVALADLTLTVNGAITLANNVSLDLAGGGVSLNGALTAGLAATVSVTSAGSPATEGNFITVSGPVSAGAEAGLSFGAGDDLTVAGPVSLGTDGTLSLSAGANLALGNVTWGTGSDVSVFANGDIAFTGALSGAPTGDLEVGAGGTITADGPVNVGTFTLSSGDWRQLVTPLPAFSAVDFRIQDGEGDDASFLRALGGDGTPGAPYLIADAYGLQGIGSADAAAAGVPDLSDSYALANDIDAGGTADWNDVEGAEGFEPIGTLDIPFVGILDGRGFAVDGLGINRNFDDAVGLFASVGAGGTVQNLTLTDATIEGGPITGGVAGVNGGLISAVRMVEGSVTGSATGDNFTVIDVGGLVGQNTSAVTRSRSSASVSGAGASFNVLRLGGLAGVNEGTVSNSMASGAVEGTGPVSMIAGGLVGLNQPEARIVRTYATGSVDTTEATNAQAGGLVGSNAGTIDQSYAVGLVTGPAGGSLGGLVGAFFVPGPPEPDGGPSTLALPPVNGVSSSYFDNITTGQTVSAGGFGISTAAFQNTLSFMAAAGLEDWSFTNTWAPPDPGHYPELYAISAVLRVDVNDATRKYHGADPVFSSSNFPKNPLVYAFGPQGDSIDVQGLLATDAVATSGVGTYTITTSPDSATSAGGVGYRLVTLDGALAVTPAPLTIIADDQRKPYGQVFTFDRSEFTIDPTTPIFDPDAVTSVAIGSPAAAGTAAAGSYPGSIIITSATGIGLGNYAIAFADGDFTVDRARLTITTDDQVKTYGNGFTFKGTEFTTDPLPLFNGDTVTSVSLSSPAAAATTNAGTYANSITASNAQGTGLGNYLITYEEGDFTVNRRPLSIPVGNRSKTYGETLASGFDYATGINGDTLRVLTASQGAGPAAPVAGNDYTIVGTGAEGPDAGNYDVTFGSGLLTVTPRPLTITADDLAKAFGRSFSFNGTEFTVGKGGLVNGDRVTAADLSSLGAAAGALPGSYTTDIDNARGSGLFVDGVANYDITYADGDFLVVQPPNLAPTFNAGLRLAHYNDLPNPVDTLDFAIEGGGGGGPTLGPTRAVASTAARERAQDTLTFLESLSDGLEERVSACAQVPPDADAFLACVGNALSEYADRIDGRILDLPEPLRQVSAVIRQSASRIEGVRADAARRIASATTDAERAAIRREAAEQASAAMQAAINEINNAIDLIRAEDDPQLASLQSEQGATITAALQNVEDELIQAVGL